jgi:thymidine phosphorylase
VRAGQPLLELHADDPSRFEPALRSLDGAIEVGPGPAPHQQLVLDRIG